MSEVHKVNAKLRIEIERLLHQRQLLAEALGRVLVHYRIIRADAELTGPELLLAAETACLPDQEPKL